MTTATYTDPFDFIARLKGSRSVAHGEGSALRKPRSATLSRERRSRRFELRVPCAQRLHAHRDEPHHELRVVVQRFDAENGADAELRVPHLHPELEVDPRRLILVLV